MKHLLRALPFLLCAGAPPLSAQAVRGELVDDRGRPVGAAFVILHDSAGAPARRALSRADGRFLLPAPGPGVYTLRAERIGYGTAVSPPLRLSAGDTLDYRMRASGAAVTLEGITVSAGSRCDVRPAQGVAAAALWEEARKALSVSAWAGEEDRVRVALVQFRRQLDGQGKVVSEQLTGSEEGPSRTPFASAPAEQLARDGYRQVRRNETWYFAPDANTLLSDAFLDTHCFRAVVGRGAEEGLVGLAFAPAGRRSVPDVQGTLWIDRRTRELRHLDYRYTRLPLVEDHRLVGGRVEFERLPNGAWIVDRWFIRMPLTRAPYRVGRNVGQPVLIGFVESGGEVREIRDAQGNHLRPPVPAPPAPAVSTGPPPP